MTTTTIDAATPAGGGGEFPERLKEIDVEGVLQTMWSDHLFLRDAFNLIPSSVYYGNGGKPTKDDDNDARNKTLGKGKRGHTTKQKQQQQQQQPKPKTKKKSSTAKPSTELRQKLRDKIAKMRADRGVDESAANAGEKTVVSGGKRKRTKDQTKTNDDGNDQDKNKSSRPQKKQRQHTRTQKKKQTDESRTDDTDKMTGETTMETTRVWGLEDGADKKEVDKRRKGGSKMKKLKQQLDTAVKERDNGVDHDDQLDKALRRMSGQRVKDDVSKIRKSIRKVHKSKEKSRDDWAKRVKAVDKDKRERQERRERNLKQRRDSKSSAKSSKSSKTSKTSKTSTSKLPKSKMRARKK